MDSRYLSLFLCTEQMTPLTNVEVVNFLAWSVTCLENGLFPEVDYYGNPFPPGSWRAAQAGKPLAGGFHASYVATGHDGKARYQTHRFCNYFSCNFICESCPGSSHLRHMSWTDWRRSGAWRKYILTHSGYTESTDASNISPWCAFRGFTLSRALHDLMHVVHLGIAKDHIAQMLHDLCVFGFEGGGSLNDQLMRLYLKF